MKKILQVYPQFNNAGTEKVIKNIYDSLNKEEYKIEFLAQKKRNIR